MIKSWGSLSAIGMGVVKSATPSIVAWTTDPLETLVKVRSGLSHTVILSRKPTTSCIRVYGSNYYGQAGFVPHLMADSLFDNESDTIDEPTLLEEGWHDEKEFTDIAVADYHSLALTGKGQVYGWGAGVLGNGSVLYSAEPVKVTLPEIAHISATGNTSLAVEKDLKSVHIWGHLSEGRQALTPLKLDLSKLDLKTCTQIEANSRNVIILYKDSKGTQQLSLLGTIETLKPPTYPYNPLYLSEPTLVTATVSMPLIFTIPAQQIRYIAMSENNIYTLDKGGVASILPFADHLNPLRVNIEEPILKMQVRSLSAIFSTRTKVYTYMGIEAKEPVKPSFMAFLMPTFGIPDVPIDANARSLVDTIVETDPEVHDFGHVDQVSLGWDSFVVGLGKDARREERD